jgi:competence protein ComGC
MRSTTVRTGISLIEILLALAIAATVAAIGIEYLRPADRHGKQRSCDLARQLLQNDAQRYLDRTGRLPSSDLRELRVPTYAGSVLPSCPASGDAYRLDRKGTVFCPEHESTREP